MVTKTLKSLKSANLISRAVEKRSNDFLAGLLPKQDTPLKWGSSAVNPSTALQMCSEIKNHVDFFYKSYSREDLVALINTLLSRILTTEDSVILFRVIDWALISNW